MVRCDGLLLVKDDLSDKHLCERLLSVFDVNCAVCDTAERLSQSLSLSRLCTVTTKLSGTATPFVQFNRLHVM